MSNYRIVRGRPKYWCVHELVSVLEGGTTHGKPGFRGETRRNHYPQSHRDAVVRNLDHNVSPDLGSNVSACRQG